MWLTVVKALLANPAVAATLAVLAGLLLASALLEVRGCVTFGSLLNSLPPR